MNVCTDSRTGEARARARAGHSMPIPRPTLGKEDWLREADTGGSGLGRVDLQADWGGRMVDPWASPWRGWNQSGLLRFDPNLRPLAQI